MYRILVADDEPTGLNHVCMILEKKCPEYEIMGTAGNGQEALELMDDEQPDILITDIRMPGMDGIELVRRVKERFPEILSVIVSGYSEFEYAKSAIQSGVCDYLLKPLVPSELKNLMQKLENKLNALYHRKRNEILRNLCNDIKIEKKQLLRYFAKGRYYAAVFRKNGLRSRFFSHSGVEIFSMEEEKIYIYGRDEMEALYFMPENLLFHESFFKVAEKIYEGEKEKAAYVTGIVYNKTFTLEQLGEISKLLYHRLDESIVVGKNQFLTDCGQAALLVQSQQERQKLNYIEQMIQCRNYIRFPEKIKELFQLWEENAYSQIHVEFGVKYIFKAIQAKYPAEYIFNELEFILDDAFCYASNMKELCESILSIAEQCIPDFHKEKNNDKETLFGAIRSYMISNIDVPLVLGDICREFGISQSSLSRMFRTYEKTSFGAYLIHLRIEKAKEILEQHPDIYIRDVAERVGYNDQFYFSRIFRSVTGVCPSEYLNQKDSENHLVIKDKIGSQNEHTEL